MTEKRKMIYVPDINPETFLFFFYKGDNGDSYSLRDYSKEGPAVLRRANSFPYSAQQILDRAHNEEPAPAHNTNDWHFWHELTCRLNRTYSIGTTDEPHSAPITAERKNPETQFPLWASDELFKHPAKSKKGQDMHRILTSPNSEDYVTWNVMQLLSRATPQTWWTGLLELTQADLPLNDPPTFHAWKQCAAPEAYEAQSRARMAASSSPEIAARNLDPSPVEGKSEIDLVLEGKTYLVFVEAKLGSDISICTTYDPARNQIARNIDVLLEVCGDRKPYFWMFAKDRGPGKAYTQLMRLYAEKPDRLREMLPHRDPTALQHISENLAIVLWRDLIALAPGDERDSVLQELKRRVC